MNFKESLNKLRNMSDEEIISKVEKATGKELVSYEGIDALVAALMGFYNGELKKKSSTGHKHTKEEITDFPSAMTPTAHNHDDRYYTENEINDKLDTKSDKSDSWKITSKVIGNKYTNSDINLISDDGFYISQSAVNKWTNLPSGCSPAFELIVKGISPNSIVGNPYAYKTQIIKNYGDNETWIRTVVSTNTSSSWGKWAKMWYSSNFDPNSKLNTSGGTISGALTVTGNIVTNGLLTANDVYLTSDRKAKTNLKIVESPLEKIKKINGYTFDWIKNKEKSAGVIAQEVEKVLPSIVYDTEQGKKVNYNGIIALLVECNKELLKRIEVLESKVR